MTQVRQIDGVWKLETEGRSVAIHGRDPLRDARAAVAAQVGSGGPSLIVAIGLGIGYLLDALDEAGWPGKVLALEPEPATLDSLLARPIARAWLENGRMRLLAAPAFDGAADAWSLFADGASAPAVIVNPALARLHPERVTAAAALAERLRAEATSNAHARRALGGRYLLNTLRNASSIAAEGNVADLFGTAAITPAIVVAAGPSLDAALPSLQAAMGTALIVCVDTALRPLLAAGIAPHLVVSVDPSEANARHLADVPSCEETCLVAEGSLDSLALEPFRGRTFFFNVSDHQPWPWMSEHGCDVGRLRAWGSVLTSAFDLVVKMGCDPIVMVGTDLAYTDDRPYCRGVVFEEDWRRRAEWGVPLAEQWADAVARHPRVEAVDVHGRPTRTAPHLAAFRNWLLEQMRSASDRRFFNATNGGILHGPGVEPLSFEQLPDVLGGARIDSNAARRHHRTRPNRLPGAAAELSAHAQEKTPSAERLLTAWEQFAPGVTRADIVDALAPRATASPHAPDSAATPSAAFAQVHMIDSWLRPWTESVPLVPMVIPAHRLVESSAVGARIFYFRTMAARLIFCSLQPPDGGLLEDGRPLKAVRSIHDVAIGTYQMCRDELHFQSSDGTDPRTNGRRYTLLVPACVAELEGLPLQEILDRGL
jgi:hypothetical protein